MERFVVVARRYLFTQGVGNGFISLFVSKRLIQGAATALLGVFVPIYIYTTTGNSFVAVGSFYALASLGYALALVPGAQLMNNFGYKKALVFGAFWTVVFHTILFYSNESNIYALLPALLGAVILLRTFHWVPYHVDFTIFTKAGERGRNVSLTYATIAFLGVVGPILAGYIISNSGFNALFMVAIVLFLASMFSYAFVPDTQERFSWGFVETWKKLFSKRYRPMTLGKFASGIEVVVTLIAWPIFLYEILHGNLFEIGAVATLVTAVTVLLQLLLGKYLDAGKNEKEKTLKVGSTLYAIGWVIKIFVLSAAQVFIVGLYHNITKIFTKTPFDALFYDMSADQGHYVDEFTVLSEISNHLGRVVGLCVVIVLALIVSIKWTFIIGAVAALFFNVIYRAVQD